MVILKRLTNADSSYTYQMLFLAGFTVNVSPVLGLLSISVAVSGVWTNQLTGNGNVIRVSSRFLNRKPFCKIGNFSGYLGMEFYG